jgi:hypothetical protein
VITAQYPAFTGVSAILADRLDPAGSAYQLMRRFAQPHGAAV